MSMRINDNIAITRAADMTAARARDMQQTGLTAGTLREINQDTEDDLQRVRDRPEVEAALVRTDSESGGNGGAQERQRREEEAGPRDDGDLGRRASERLLNLPVSNSKDAEVETKRFDIRV